MSSAETEDDIRTAVALRDQYAHLAQKFDTLLHQAHALQHGSPEIVEILKAANDVGKEMSGALRRYHASVRLLAAQYEERRQSREK